MATEKTFPNGFVSWVETHHEIVEYITQQLNINNSKISKEYENSGRGYIYELGEKLTDKFEEIHAQNDWKLDDFFTELDKFVKLNV